jgi:hypothetical protein
MANEIGAAHWLVTILGSRASNVDHEPSKRAPTHSGTHLVIGDRICPDDPTKQVSHSPHERDERALHPERVDELNVERAFNLVSEPCDIRFPAGRVHMVDDVGRRREGDAPTVLHEHSSPQVPNRPKPIRLVVSQSGLKYGAGIDCGAIRDGCAVLWIGGHLPVPASVELCRTYNGTFGMFRRHFGEDPNAGRILQNGPAYVGEEVRRMSVVVIRGKDVRSLAGKARIITVRVEPTARAGYVATSELNRELLHFARMLVVGVVRDDNFERSDGLAAPALQAAPENLGTIAGDECDAKGDLAMQLCHPGAVAADLVELCRSRSV